MISNDDHLQRTRKALHHLEAALAALNREKSTIHPDRFAFMAEPIADHIRQLRSEIDEFIGMPAAAQAVEQARTTSAS